ncbi:hypothetical protein RQP46_007949 [Phenoliferia psychrophenolica]
MPSELSSLLPPTLQAWRQTPTTNTRSVWQPLEAFLRSRGYELFTGGFPQRPVAGRHSIRAPDGYHRWAPASVQAPQRSAFCPQTPIQIAARSLDGKDVVIRLLTRASEGHTHLRILEFLAAAPCPENRAVPLIEVMYLEDMAFGVFPMLRASGLEGVWFSSNREVLEACEEIVAVRVGFFAA